MRDHLYSAARVYEQILRELHPGYTFVVEFREPDTDDRSSDTPVTPSVDDAGATLDHAHAHGDRHDMPAPARARDKHTLEQAA